MPRSERRPTGTEDPASGDAAGASCRGGRAAGSGSHGRLRGCPGSAPRGVVDGWGCRYLLGKILVEKKEEEERRKKEETEKEKEEEEEEEEEKEAKIRAHLHVVHSSSW